MSCPFKISSCKCPDYFRKELEERKFSLAWAWHVPINKIKSGIEVAHPVDRSLIL
ncbi:MAG: hypothetical protein F6J93_40010 [Oscillatoria sp. SIO1A7]|nr:hypothetical protein [Oscillatoria sp. SIO1A7]